jgi:peroxidase
LRQFKNGKLQINAKQILPQRANNGTCDYDCYYSAETRAAPFFTLALIHSVFFRLHNQVAEELYKVNPRWNDEKLYQESPRIVIAIYQRVVYDEWIPTLFGADFAAKYKLNTYEAPYCGSYNPNIDASASNEFSHAAFRQFHANLPEKFNFYDASLKVYRTVPLYETDNGPTILEKEYNAVIRGLINDPNVAGPTSFSDTMRNKIFDNFNPRKLGMDIPSNDILVGRDQGLSPYHMYLEKFFGIKVNTWDDLLVTISKQNINKLKNLYAGVQDLDLFVGLSLEYRDYTNYKYVGPVGKHILGEQYNRSKFGDRFFYCLRNNGNPFTLSQLIEINQWTLGRILCQTTDIENMLPKAFQTPSSTNKWTSCKLFRPLSLSAWKA